jgi:hypothetical protein
MYFNKINSKKTFLIMAYILIMGALLWVADKNRIQNIKPLERDSKEVVFSAYHLVNLGKHSIDGENLSHFREPLLAVINAINILAIQPNSYDLDKENYTNNPDWILKITRLNIFLLIVLIFSIIYLTSVLEIPFIYSLIANILTIGYFAIYTLFITAVNSEIPSAILLTLFSAMLIKYIKFKEMKFSIMAGVFLGLLALTKAVFYYLFFVFFPLLILVVFFFEKKSLLLYKSQFFMFAISFCIVVLPWMIRNFYHFEDFSITERGGQVLYIRAVKNQMNREEYKGAFYAYAPVYFQKNIFGKYLGYRPSDLEYGGKLQRLNRSLPQDSIAIAEGRTEDVISFLRRAQIDYLAGFNPIERRGLIMDDQELKVNAKSMILNDLGAHIKTSFVFAWRGIWFYRGRHLPLVLLTFFSFMSLPIIFVSSMSKDKLPYLVFSLLPVLYFLFHAGLSHFIPRYTATLLPIMTVCLIILMYKLIIRMTKSTLNTNSLEESEKSS